VLFGYWELTKPEINFVIAIATAAGFWMGTAVMPGSVPEAVQLADMQRL
jgi:heme O synthase-like polyprenyltransferase